MKRLMLMTMVAAVLACRGAEPESGVWNDDFTGSLAYAESEGLPIVVVWGNTSCSHCNNLHEALDESAELEEWLAEHDVILVMKHEKYGSKNADYLAAKEWLKAINPSMSGFPFVGVHYKRTDGAVVASSAFTARDGTMPITEPADDLAGQFVGSLELLLGSVERESIKIATKSLPASEVSVAYDERLEAEGGQGAVRWEVLPRGYDVTDAPTDDAWMNFAFGGVGDVEELPYDFPVNDSSVRKVLVMPEGELFLSGADGVRLLLRPLVVPLGTEVTWTDLGYRALGDCAAFRWKGYNADLGEIGVLVELMSDGRVHYAYSRSLAAAGKLGFGQHLSVLDGDEWRWDGEPAQFGCDWRFAPQAGGPLPEGLMLSADGNLLGVPATNAEDSVVRIMATDAIGERSVRMYGIAVKGILPAGAYAIAYKANGGSGTMASTICMPNAVYGLAKCAFVRAGKRFAGWRCSNGRRYDDGMLVFNLAQPGETVTMTAIWE